MVFLWMFCNFLGILLPSIIVYKKRICRGTTRILILTGILILCLSIALQIHKSFFIIFILIISSYFFIFDKVNIKFIVYLITFYLSLNIIDILQSLILINILKVNIDQIINNYFIQTFINIDVSVINIVFGILIEKIVEKIKSRLDYINQNKKSMFIIITNLLIMCLIVIILIGLFYEKKLIVDRYFNYLSFFIIIFFILNLVTCYMVVYYSNKEAYVNFKEKEMQALAEYTNILEGLNTDVRKFRHDYTNMLATMSEYFNNEDFKGLKNFFRRNILPLGEDMNTKNLRLGLLKNIKIQEVKGILVSKIIKAQEQGIEVLVDISDEIDNINMDLIHLARIIGIIMDNAIEASFESTEKIIRLGIFMKGKDVNIIVENSYLNKDIYLHNILKEGYSTKGVGRGLGLNILMEIVSSYKNTIIDTIIEKEKFIQHIIIS